MARETLSHGTQKIQALHLKFIMTRIEVLLTWTFIKIRSVQEMSFFCFTVTTKMFKTTLNFKTKLAKLNSKLRKSWFILINFLFSHKIHIVIALLMLYPPNLQYFEPKVSILWIPLRFLTLLAGAVAYCAQHFCRILGRFLSPTLL